jgi:hypothetical protein
LDMEIFILQIAKPQIQPRNRFKIAKIGDSDWKICDFCENIATLSVFSIKNKNFGLYCDQCASEIVLGLSRIVYSKQEIEKRALSQEYGR